MACSLEARSRPALSVPPAAAPFRFLGLLFGGLGGHHVACGNAKDVLGVVAESDDIHDGARRQAARELFPLREDRLDVCRNEIAQAHGG
jgi:hypothetical protein